MPLKFFRKLTKRFFILTNLGIAALFLLGSYGYYFDPHHFWFIGLLTIGCFFLLVLLVLFVLFWLIAKPAYMLISIVAIALAWVPTKHLVQLRMAPNFAVKKHPSHLRVMNWNAESFNLLNRKKNPGGKNEIVSIVKKYDPDVAIFQEATIGDQNPGAINYLPEMLQAFKMKYYHYSYGQTFDKDHKYGKIIFSKYPLVSKHVIHYGKKDYNSMYQFADVVFNKDTLRLFNLHLQSLRLSPRDRSYIGEGKDYNVDETKNILWKLKYGFVRRKIQADRVKGSVDKSPYPVIVCGDFNDVPNSYAYHTIGNNLKNAFTEKGTGLGRTFKDLSPTLRIDNIFVSPQISVEQFTVVRQNAVEHNPLVADLFYNKAE